MRKIILILFINLSFSQKHSINLEKILTKNKLTDYGYGLTKKIDNDSIFDYQVINKSNINYREITNIIRKEESKIKIKKKNGFITKIIVSNNNYILENNYLEMFDNVTKAYYFQIFKKDYFLLFLNNSKDVNLRTQILGVIIDNNKIIPLPELQSSDSLLSLADLNCGKSLDYISYNPSYKETLDIYSLKNFKFEKIMTVKLLSFDGYVWTINYDDFFKEIKNRREIFSEKDNKTLK